MGIKKAFADFYGKLTGTEKEFDGCLKNYVNNTFSIYQLKDTDTTKDLRFISYDKLTSMEKGVDSANYEHIYIGILTEDMSLDDIYFRFNVNHPKDYKGHSLSVSDVVVLNVNGSKTAYYVDIAGFKKLSEFL